MNWPLWTKIYAVVVGVPMVGISLALTLWIVLLGLGDAIDAPSTLGRMLIAGVYLVAFITTAWLFAASIWRIVTQRSEALLYAATGHLLLAMPAGMFVAVSYVRQPIDFINDIDGVLDGEPLNQAVRFVMWVVVHTYFALFLSLSDASEIS